jgi:hypothetical protein
VLFPGGSLALRIFEPRYLDMVSQCLRSDSGFGIALIRTGQEVGGPALTHEVGTLATITDWRGLPGGLLGITATGQQRFRIRATETQANSLVTARVHYLPTEQDSPVPAEYHWLRGLLENAMIEAGATVDIALLENAVWLGYRLAESLPLEAQARQDFLEIDDPIARLDAIAQQLASFKPQ